MKRRCISCSSCSSRCGAPDTNFVDFVGAADLIFSRTFLGRYDGHEKSILYTKQGVYREEKTDRFYSSLIADLHVVFEEKQQFFEKKTTETKNIFGKYLELIFDQIIFFLYAISRSFHLLFL